MRRLLIVAVFLMIVIWKTPVLAADLSEITENMVLETGVDAKLYEEASDKSLLWWQVRLSLQWKMPGITGAESLRGSTQAMSGLRI